MYNRSQNKVPIAERLHSDFTVKINGKVVDKFTHRATIDVSLRRLF